MDVQRSFLLGFAFVVALGTLGSCAAESGVVNTAYDPTKTNQQTQGVGTCVAYTCAECIRSTGCGWCGSAGACMPGAATGSTDGTCYPPAWTADPLYCAAAPQAPAP